MHAFDLQPLNVCPEERRKPRLWLMSLQSTTQTSGVCQSSRLLCGLRLCSNTAGILLLLSAIQRILGRTASKSYGILTELTRSCADIPAAQCTTLQHYAITQACFNISSDAFMLAISLPLLISTTLPMKQKIVLLVVFGMGTFVVSFD